MVHYITVDGGTTNTRLSLVCDRTIKDTVKYGIGAAVGCHDKQALKQVLKEGIATLLCRNRLGERDVSRVLASGMITSEGGICTLPHRKTPCGIAELAADMHECVLPDVSAIPFVFARGVITDTQDVARLDMMRGEETELFGLTERPEHSCAYVLLGTHTKIIYTDEEARIRDFKTVLSGELLAAVCEHTVLKSSVTLSPDKTDEDALQEGYVYAKTQGIGAALFKVRVLDKALGAARERCFGFLLGAVLQGEVDSIARSDAARVVVGGKRELREPLVALLRQNTAKEILAVEDTVAQAAAAYGVIRLYEKYMNRSMCDGKAL